jgi:hypothetical protein
MDTLFLLISFLLLLHRTIFLTLLISMMTRQTAAGTIRRAMLRASIDPNLQRRQWDT